MENDRFEFVSVPNSVSFSADFGGGDVRQINGLEVKRDYDFSDAEFSSIFNSGSPGTIALRMSPNNGYDDVDDDIYNLTFSAKPIVEVSKLNGSSASTVTISSGSIDLAQDAVTRILSGNGTPDPSLDPGFDLQVSNLSDGVDDVYRLDLVSAPTINTLRNEVIIESNTHSLQVSDQFSVDLGADQFAIGDTFSVDVDSAHLQDGTVYTIQNQLGRFEVGDQLIVDADHAFQSPIYTVSSNVDTPTELILLKMEPLR